MLIILISDLFISIINVNVIIRSLLLFLNLIIFYIEILILLVLLWVVII